MIFVAFSTPTCRPGDLEYATSNSVFLQPGSLNVFEAYNGQMYTEGMFIAQGANK